MESVGTKGRGVMNSEEILGLFFDSGALVKGHFLLTSGRHSDMILQIAKVFTKASCCEKLSKELASRFDEPVDIVIGPALGGVILAYEVARQLAAVNIYCEREEGRMKLKRGFTIKRGQKVLIVEDVVTTGASLNEVLELVKKAGGKTIGIGVIVDRALGAVDFGVRMESLVQLDIASFAPDECPMCEQKEPLTKPPGVR
jgi:orotate phosphoribosyltransferase